MSLNSINSSNLIYFRFWVNLVTFSSVSLYTQIWPILESGADAIKKFTPSLGIPDLGV